MYKPSCMLIICFDILLTYLVTRACSVHANRIAQTTRTNSHASVLTITCKLDLAIVGRLYLASKIKTIDDSYGRTDCELDDYVLQKMDDLFGNSDCDLSEYVDIKDEDIPKYIEEHGMSGIEKIFKAKLEDWENVEVQIGVTGNSGVGKSSFINGIRG